MAGRKKKAAEAAGTTDEHGDEDGTATAVAEATLPTAPTEAAPEPPKDARRLSPKITEDHRKMQEKADEAKRARDEGVADLSSPLAKRLLAYCRSRIERAKDRCSSGDCDDKGGELLQRRAERKASEDMVADNLDASGLEKAYEARLSELREFERQYPAFLQQTLEAKAQTNAGVVHADTTTAAPTS